MTQFEPSLARRAFVSARLPSGSTLNLQCFQQPCFDHPAKKATFSITLISPFGLTSLSNSAEMSRAKSDGRFPESEALTQEFLAGNEGILAKREMQEILADADGDWEVVAFAKTPMLSTYIDRKSVV